MPHPVIVMILHNSVFDSSLFNFAGVKWGGGGGGGGVTLTIQGPWK